MSPPQNSTPTRIVPTRAASPEAHTSAVLSVRDVSLGYPLGGETVPVLDAISLSVAQGEFVSIVGPSGSGKSTLLRLIAGLEEPDSGAITLEGRSQRLGLVGWMPQRDLLHPWLDAVGNAATGLQVRGVPKPEARERARILLAQFGLDRFEHAAPRELSGGMRQRVALARTVLGSGALMLLDEPFGALDTLTRSRLQAWLLDVWPSLGKSAIMVTHDVEEALLLSDTVYALSPRPGRVRERVTVPFARPRDPRGVVATPSFVEQKLRLLDVLAGGQ